MRPVTKLARILSNFCGPGGKLGDGEGYRPLGMGGSTGRRKASYLSEGGKKEEVSKAQ